MTSEWPDSAKLCAGPYPAGTGSSIWLWCLCFVKPASDLGLRVSVVPDLDVPKEAQSALRSSLAPPVSTGVEIQGVCG